GPEHLLVLRALAARTAAGRVAGRRRVGRAGACDEPGRRRGDLGNEAVSIRGPDADPSPAFYALRGGGWRDWLSLPHPPDTAGHLSYVAFGALAAPRPLHTHRLGWSVL